MPNKWKEIKEKIFLSPLFKTVSFGFSVIVSGILCGSYVNELTVNNKVEFHRTFEILPTYIILIYLALIYIYLKFLYTAEKNILNFANKEHCVAYTRSQLIPELNNAMKTHIRTGRIDLAREYGRFLDEIQWDEPVKEYNR